MAFVILPKLTLFGRSLLLIVCELAANAICWIVAGIIFGRNHGTRQILSLALLAWTLGLRHALDADHISAIDNATRGLISHGQLPVTCGLFFSLGHSTIVIIITIAIAISSNVYNRIDGIGRVGGIIGASVSGSFLFIIGVANSIILWKIIKRRRKDKIITQMVADGQLSEEEAQQQKSGKEHHTIMLRILGPIITFVNRPWKMYPVGVLFGLGFDTASSIALLAVSAIAKKTTGGASIPSSHVVILPLLFTAGMSLVDSADSVLMLYSYAGFPDRRFSLFEKTVVTGQETAATPSIGKDPETAKEKLSIEKEQAADSAPVAELPENKVQTQAKMNVMSGLSIVLTLMSILVALSISLITIMSLIGEECVPCSEAAESDDGLAGRWWRGWAHAGEQSGYIGAAIVGVFLSIVICYYGGRWAITKWGKKRNRKS
ncbi:high-affinity nickel-transport protein-domain-containing protein [Panaeolus papilionaceus]|nr:high-affinity nickel-transport protein-domain-containing protein [Panaeolus papilionaceus]